MFAGTNIDDLVVLTVLFLGSWAGGRPRAWQIWAGQYTGIAALVVLSGLAALGLGVIPDDRVRLLGLVPFGLGVWSLVKALRSRGAGAEPEPAVAGGVLQVAGVTIAGGADNISVYTPVFRTLGFGGTTVTVAVFAAGVALWCVAASWLGSHDRVVSLVERYGHWAVPVVFMLLGVMILADFG